MKFYKIVTTGNPPCYVHMEPEDLNAHTQEIGHPEVAEITEEEYSTSVNNMLYPIQRLEKISKINNVANIKVTTSSGNVFDGDERSQDRLARAINVAQITGLTETEWKLADNTTATVTLDELKEALALAGLEMSRIWLGK